MGTIVIFGVILFLFVKWINASNAIDSKAIINKSINSLESPTEHLIFREPIKSAISTRKRLRIKYKDIEGVITVREITPKALFYLDSSGDLALSSYCHLRGDERTFIVNRIVELKSV
jgi:predicted DNA-binding transcriptional regulator YafY